MKIRLFALPLFTLLGLSVVLAQQDEGTSDSKPTATQPVSPQKNIQAEREAILKKRLTNAVLRGAFQMTDEQGLKGRAPMTKPSVERYEIASITKLGGDMWSVMARIQYADRDVLVPVPVHVHWAAGTPIITLDEMTIPMIGTYSARVIIDDGFYAGTWRGPTYGGVLSGQILKKADVAKIEKMEKAGWTMQMPRHGEKTSEGTSDDAVNGE